MFCISILVRLDPNYAYVTVKVNIKFEVFGNVEVKVGKSGGNSFYIVNVRCWAESQVRL